MSEVPIPVYVHVDPDCHFFSSHRAAARARPPGLARCVKLR